MNSKKSIPATPVETHPDEHFGLFYTTYYKRFVRYAFYYLNDWQAAEDITHDAILYYYENKKQLPETDALGYLLSTVRNKCLNYLKHLQVKIDYNKKHTELQTWEINARIMTLEDADYTDIFTKDIMQIVTQSLQKLPLQTREIFILHRIKNLPRKEIAAKLNVSLQKIDYHINKANNQLYKDLKDYIPFILLFFPKIFGS